MRRAGNLDVSHDLDATLGMPRIQYHPAFDLLANAVMFRVDG